MTERDADEPLHEHLDRLGGELDTLALMQDLYTCDDIEIPWSTYVLPAKEDELAAKAVIDTYREYKDEMPTQKLRELDARVSDELNRRSGDPDAE